MHSKAILKTILFTNILTIGLAANAVDAIPSDYYYVGVKGGVVQPTNLSGTTNLSGNAENTTYTVGAFLGRKFMDRFAVEVEYMYRGDSKASNTTTFAAGGTGAQRPQSWSSKSNSMMLNFSIDLTKSQEIRPYLKAGAGVSSNKSGSYSQVDETFNIYSGKTTTNFAYQAGAGLNMPINNKFDVNVEYMFVNRGKISTSSSYVEAASAPTPSTSKIGYIKDHVVTVGIKLKF